MLVAASFAFMVALGAEQAPAQDVLIRGARVHTVSAQGVLDAADVLIRDGKIARVGRGLVAPAEATVVQADGRALTPGLFGGLLQIGVREISAESSTVDAGFNAQAPVWNPQWRPEFDATLAYNPHSVLIPVARLGGLTWAMLAPSGNDSLFAGQGAAVTLDGRYDAVLNGSRSLFVQLGSGGSESSGGSRAAQYMLLDQAVGEARSQSPEWPGAALRPAGKAVLAGYLAGGRVVFRVERAADIRQAIAFARRNGLRPVISGGSEAWRVAHELAQAHVPVILNTLQDLPTDFDRIGSRLDNAALLARAGVLIAFSDDDSYVHAVRQQAGNAVAHGLPWDAALAAITANPAEIFGLAAARGRIAAGQVADLVLWDGDPLEVTTLADRVWIAGRAVEMRSRQTELRDRYRGRLPQESNP